MRVRTGRFERLRLCESGHSELVGPFDGEDGVEELGTVAPPATGASRHLQSHIGFCSPGGQFPKDSPALLPLLELDSPQTVTHPLVQLSPDPRCLRQPEVGFPSAHEDAQPLYHRFEGSTRHAGRQLANANLERLDCLVGNPSLDHPPWCLRKHSRGICGRRRRQRRSWSRSPSDEGGHKDAAAEPSPVHPPAATAHRRCSRRHSGGRHGLAVQAPCPPHPAARWPEAATAGPPCGVPRVRLMVVSPSTMSALR